MRFYVKKTAASDPTINDLLIVMTPIVQDHGSDIPTLGLREGTPLTTQCVGVLWLTDNYSPLNIDQPDSRDMAQVFWHALFDAISDRTYAA